MLQSFLQYLMESKLFLEQLLLGILTGGRKISGLGDENPFHCIAWAPGQIANAMLYAIWQLGRDKYIITVVCNLYRRFRPDSITPPGSKQALICKSHIKRGDCSVPLQYIINESNNCLFEITLILIDPCICALCKCYPTFISIPSPPHGGKQASLKGFLCSSANGFAQKNTIFYSNRFKQQGDR